MKTLVEQNKILQVVVGSQTYGTSTPESDTDYTGILIAPKRYYLGLDKLEEVDCSVISKREDGKNDKDAIDSKFYELRKFIKLAIENNPNILEILFTPKDKIVFSNEFGALLLKNAELFPHKGLKQKFLGYSFSQKHKMLIKTSNYTTLNQFNDWLDENVKEPNEYNNLNSLTKPYYYRSNQLFAELRPELYLKDIVKFHEHHALVGDINISLTDKLTKVHNKIKERLSKVGNREELYTKYGYDTKFGMHLVRLMLEGKELLLTGKLEYPLKGREMLLDIRNGKWTSDDIIKYSEQLEAEIEGLTEKSDLPSKPRYNEIENLLIEMVESHWNK
jgi:predicted nucleotidyltransferase